MFDDAARYGINAMELLINKLLKLGAFRGRLNAKFFGGAHIIRSVDEMYSPGLKNAEFVRNFLKVENVPVISEDVGGINARKIYFHTDTGDIFLKRVPAFKFSRIISDEAKHGEAVRKDLLKETKISIFK
jgi:chemotaxis protein CheD